MIIKQNCIANSFTFLFLEHVQKVLSNFYFWHPEYFLMLFSKIQGTYFMLVKTTRESVSQFE